MGRIRSQYGRNHWGTSVHVQVRACTCTVRACTCTVAGTIPGTCTQYSTNEGKDKEKLARKDEVPELITPEMREQIGLNVLRPEHTAKMKGFLERSETACDDTHQFNPSRFDIHRGQSGAPSPPAATFRPLTL